MNLLLDTHVWIWSQEEPERLGPKVGRALISSKYENYVSPISTLEVARLLNAGHISLSMPLEGWVDQSLASIGANTAPLGHDVAMEAYRIPEPFHKDPADRLLVATARINGLVLVTADEKILSYPHLKTLDART